MKNLILGLILGIAAVVGLRFTLAAPAPPTHYHANWAIFVNGERVDLTADEYMEESGACVLEDGVAPSERGHLHDNNHDVVHVHHEGVTWGHVLANLGFGLGDHHLVTDDGRLFVEDDTNTLEFVVNGLEVPSLHNRRIASEDRVLISYGPETGEEVLRTQFPAVASNAARYNQESDPTGCSGTAEPTLWDRVRHAFTG